MGQGKETVKMEFNEGDYIINMHEFKAALFDILADMSKNDDTDGEDVVVTTAAFEKCLAVVEKVGERMA